MLIIMIKISPLISAIKQSKTTNVTILNPVVHLLGDDAASIGYIKVTQTLEICIISDSVHNTTYINLQNIINNESFGYFSD